jgi:hypothetical protein
MKIPRWAQICIGVAIVAVFLAIAGLIAVAALVRQNVQSETKDESDALVEFDQVRKEFSGRGPIIELKDGQPYYTAAGKASLETSDAKLETLYVLAWDADDERITRVSIPFWLLRMKNDPIRLATYAAGLDEGRVTLRPSDLDKHGPGLILDTSTNSNDRVLVWAR